MDCLIKVLSCLWNLLEAGMLIGTIYFSYYNYLVMKKNNDDISVILTCEGKEDIKLEQTVKRKNVTRSEIQGVLRNYYLVITNEKEVENGGAKEVKTSNNYDIDFLKTKEYFDKLIDIQSVDRKHVFHWVYKNILRRNDKELPKELIIKINSENYKGFSSENRDKLEEFKKKLAKEKAETEAVSIA